MPPKLVYQTHGVYGGVVNVIKLTKEQKRDKANKYKAKNPVQNDSVIIEADGNFTTNINTISQNLDQSHFLSTSNKIIDAVSEQGLLYLFTMFYHI